MNDTLAQTVESFLQKQYRRNTKEKTTATNLLKGGTKESEQNKKSYAFLNQRSISSLMAKPITDREALECIPVAVKESTLSYPKEKNAAIEIYKKYLAFLHKAYGVSVDIIFPPVFNSQFDRQMYIVKSIHERKYRSVEIADELWLSDKTIQSDLQELEAGITIMGQALKINKHDITARKKDLNTVHPIFLSSNLTQIVVLLRGLEHQAQDQAYHEYAVRLAANIWSELSDYGRRRIMTVSEQLSLNISWFEMLEERRNKELYSNEADCSYADGVGNVLYFLKNGKRCTIEVQYDDRSEILNDCLIKSHFSGNHLTVLHKEKELILSIDSIVSACECEKCIF